MEQITLDSSQYEDLFNCLSNFKEICNDIDIREAVLRQRSNDHTCIVEVDLTPLLGDSSIALTSLKEKIELLKTFIDQEVTITIDDEFVMFSDQYTAIKFRKPTLELLDNTFMTEQELDTIYNVTEEDLVLDYEIPTLITNRIKNITRGFNTTTIQVNFGGEEAALNYVTQSQDQHVKFVDGITLNEVIENRYSPLIVVPFLIEHETPISLRMCRDSRRRNTNQEILLNKFHTTLGDITMNLYNRSEIFNYDED